MRSEAVKWHENIDMEAWKVLLAETLIFEWDLIKNIQRSWSSFQMLVYAQSTTAQALLSTAEPPIYPQFSADDLKLKCMEWLKAHRASNFEDCPGCPGNIQVSIAGQPF